MSNVTLEGIAELLKQELGPIKTTLAEHTELLNSHTTSLETLLSAKKTKDDENTVSVHRFKRLEDWAEQVGKQLGIKLEL